MPHKPRLDLFDALERNAVSRKSPQDPEYDRIQLRWAEARKRRDEFFRQAKTLQRNIGGIKIDVRPIMGHSPPRLKLVVTIPEGVNATHIEKAASEITGWRTQLTQFQGPTLFLGLEDFAELGPAQKTNKPSSRLKLKKTRGPVEIAEALNQRLAVYLTDVVLNEDREENPDPPWNSDWLLSEAREQMSAWGVKEKEQEDYIRPALSRVRLGQPAFHTIQRGRSAPHLDGPFTADHIKKYLRNWRTRRRHYGL